MKLMNSLFVIPVVLASIAAGAQQQPAATMEVNRLLDSWVTNAETHVVPAADAMPEGKYSFAPADGEFTGVRTFAQQVKHVAATNYRLAAYILNQQPTSDQESETGPDSVQSKLQIMDYLAASFTTLHKAVATITDRNLGEPLPRMSNRPALVRTRVQLTVDAISHAFDHYGQMVEYLRMNGIVPPDSRK